MTKPTKWLCAQQRLIWVFAGCPVTLLVLSCRGSNNVILMVTPIGCVLYMGTIRQKNPAPVKTGNPCLICSNWQISSDFCVILFQSSWSRFALFRSNAISSFTSTLQRRQLSWGEIWQFDDNNCSYYSVGIMPTFHQFSCDQIYSFKLWHFIAEPDS